MGSDDSSGEEKRKPKVDESVLGLDVSSDSESEEKVVEAAPAKKVAAPVAVQQRDQESAADAAGSDSDSDEKKIYAELFRFNEKTDEWTFIDDVSVKTAKESFDFFLVLKKKTTRAVLQKVMISKEAGFLQDDEDPAFVWMTPSEETFNLVFKTKSLLAPIWTKVEMGLAASKRRRPPAKTEGAAAEAPKADLRAGLRKTGAAPTEDGEPSKEAVAGEPEWMRKRRELKEKNAEAGSSEAPASANSAAGDEAKPAWMSKGLRKTDGGELLRKATVGEEETPADFRSMLRKADESTSRDANIMIPMPKPIGAPSGGPKPWQRTSTTAAPAAAAPARGAGPAVNASVAREGVVTSSAPGVSNARSQFEGGGGGGGGGDDVMAARAGRFASSYPGINSSTGAPAASSFGGGGGGSVTDQERLLWQKEKLFMEREKLDWDREKMQLFAKIELLEKDMKKMVKRHRKELEEVMKENAELKGVHAAAVEGRQQKEEDDVAERHRREKEAQDEILRRQRKHREPRSPSSPNQEREATKEGGRSRRR